MGPIFKAKHPKLAEFVTNKMPDALNVVGGFLPEKGALGILKNIITSDSTLSPGDRTEVTKMLLDAQELEMQDMADARNREIQIATNEHAPLINKIIQPVLALLILGSCFFFWYQMLYVDIPKEKEVQLAGITGALTTLSMGVVGYYFGSSTGSAAKQKQLDAMMDK
ncbi:MAG: hypothetical protein V4549_06445 [Bacteroidota bacterium]